MRNLDTLYFSQETKKHLLILFFHRKMFLNRISDCNQKTLEFENSDICVIAVLPMTNVDQSASCVALWAYLPRICSLSLLSQTGPVNHSVREGAKRKIWIQRLNTDNSKILINYLFYRYQYERGKNFTARQDQKYTSKKI